MPATDRALFQIQDDVVRCRLCPRLVEWRERTARDKVRRYREERYWGRPIPAFGSADASLLLVGLAPAAHGGNRTGRMFTGDSSGDWLFEALHRFGFANQPASIGRADGLELADCLVTAAVRCAPPANRPLPEEMDRCRRYLRRELELLSSLKAVVALGRIGFEAFLKAWRETRGPVQPRPVFGHRKETVLPGGVVLVSSYHPSRQNTQTGRLTREMFHGIFRRARQIVDR